MRVGVKIPRRLTVGPDSNMMAGRVNQAVAALNKCLTCCEPYHELELRYN